MREGLYEKLLEEVGEESIYRTLNVLGYEYGDVQKYVFYSEIHPDYADVYRGYILSGLADMLAQIKVIIERYGWDFNKVSALGSERFLRSDNKHKEKR